MKFILPLFLIAATASAFSTARFAVRQPTLLRSKADASAAIKEALAASEEFGAASPQARVAWDIVEEIGSADNSSAFAGGVSDEESIGREYQEKLSALADLLEENMAKIKEVSTLASDIQSFKLVQPEPMPVTDTTAMRAALAEAKEAAEKFGTDSIEARLAWETVEEIASSGKGEESRPSLYDVCLSETLAACEALGELSKAVELEKKKTADDLAKAEEAAKNKKGRYDVVEKE